MLLNGRAINAPTLNGETRRRVLGALNEVPINVLPVNGTGLFESATTLPLPSGSSAVGGGRGRRRKRIIHVPFEMLRTVGDEIEIVREARTAAERRVVAELDEMDEDELLELFTYTLVAHGVI